MQQIATKLHLLQALAHAQGVALPDTSDWKKYVLTSDVLALTESEQGQATLRALDAAGIRRLPHDRMVIEGDISSPELTATVRLFAIVRARDDYTSVMLALDKVVSFRDKDEEDKINNLALARTLHDAMRILTNTRGIAQTVISAPALNKARAKRGERPVPDHVLVHVGTVYDRHGKAVPKASQHLMPMHLRAGHVRHQRHGVGLSETKLIFIEPVLVNYQEDAPLWNPTKVLVP